MVMVNESFEKQYRYLGTYGCPDGYGKSTSGWEEWRGSRDEAGHSKLIDNLNSEG